MAPAATQPVLFVTQYYWPEIVGSGPYCTDMAEWLAERGLPVKVFTSRPHYPDGAVGPAYRDGLRDSERKAGVSIERVPPLILRRRGAFGRIAADAAFLFRGLVALAGGRMRRADTVVSLCPSVLTVLLGVLAKRPGGQHIAIVHDIQSGLAAGLGMVESGWVLRAMRWLERVVLNRVDSVLVLSENMRRHLTELGVESEIEILPLWVDTQRIRPVECQAGAAATVLYSGNFGKKQALDQIVDMADILQKEAAGISVVLRGDGVEAERLVREVALRGLHNVRFARLIPAERLNEGLAEGSIHLVPQDGSSADFAVPSKLYAIMAAGRPFVATARPGSMLWKLMERSSAFFCVPSGDVAALTDGVKRLAGDPALCRQLGLKGRSYVVKHHDKKAVLDRFFAALRAGKPIRVESSGERAASLDL